MAFLEDGTRLGLGFGMQYHAQCRYPEAVPCSETIIPLPSPAQRLPQVLQNPNWATGAFPLSHPIWSIPFCPSQMLPMAGAGRLGWGAAVCLGSLPVWISPP